MIERKYLVHYINASDSSETSDYEKIGKDLEEFNVEMNANVDKKNNIWGETSVNVTNYQPQASVEPYYADKGTSLHTRLQNIIDNRLTGDALKTDVVEVHTWEESGKSSGEYVAYREEGFIEVSSYGGDTTGYQIAYNVHFTGVRTKGTFNPNTKQFTEAA